MSGKKRSGAEILRKREYARRYRETHRDVIKAYNLKYKKRVKDFKQSVFEGFLRNPRKLLNEVKVRRRIFR